MGLYSAEINHNCATQRNISLYKEILKYKIII